MNGGEDQKKREQDFCKCDFLVDLVTFVAFL